MPRRGFVTIKKRLILERKKVLAVMDDLFFTVKINEAARRAGLDIEFVKSEIDAIAKSKDLPTLMIFDLNCTAVEPLDLISKIKNSPDTKRVSLLGYLSHIQGELKQKAQESGCDTVLARSAFSQNLPLIFKRHASNH